jgi:hypothetical protein
LRKFEIDIDQRPELTERLAHTLNAQGHDIPPRGVLAQADTVAIRACRPRAQRKPGVSRRSSPSTSD